jgi:hypothetical protein
VKSSVYRTGGATSEDFLDAYEELVEAGILSWEQIEEYESEENFVLRSFNPCLFHYKHQIACLNCAGRLLPTAYLNWLVSLLSSVSCRASLNPIFQLAFIGRCYCYPVTV